MSVVVKRFLQFLVRSVGVIFMPALLVLYVAVILLLFFLFWYFGRGEVFCLQGMVFVTICLMVVLVGLP